MSTDVTAFMRELYPLWKRHTQLSKPLVQALSTATATGQHAWQQAREQQSFSIFAPHLSEIISLTKEKITELGVKQHPYDTLIDEFEPGMTVAQLDAIFTPLTKQTIDFLSTLEPNNPMRIQGPFDPTIQLQYSKELMTAMGYDTHRGRLDISTHPFTIDIHPTDVHNHESSNTLFSPCHPPFMKWGTGYMSKGLINVGLEPPMEPHGPWAFMNRNRDYGRFLLVNRCHFGRANFLGFMPCFHPQNLMMHWTFFMHHIGLPPIGAE